ncbi:MAG: hypothetical protein IJ161_12885 [Bacteroidales bacterium]|nr:hypothetical protein [Bacteroidales bacterium]
MFDKNEVLKKKEQLQSTIERNGGVELTNKIGFYACSCSGGCDGSCEQSCEGKCWGCGKS